MRFKKQTVATFAIVGGLALAGTGGAVAANTIGSSDIQNHTVRSVDVKNNNLRGMDVKNGTIGFRDLNGYTQDRIDAANAGGEQGPAGPKGEQGPAGKDGTNGTDGVSGYEVLNAEARWSNAAGTTTASCATGKVALGGGFVVEGIRGGDAEVKASQPVYSNGTATGWTVSGVATGEANVKAWVTCAAVN